MKTKGDVPNSGRLTRTGVEKRTLAEIAGQAGSSSGSNHCDQLPSLMNQHGSSSHTTITNRPLKELLGQ